LLDPAMSVLSATDLSAALTAAETWGRRCEWSPSVVADRIDERRAIETPPLQAPRAKRELDYDVLWSYAALNFLAM
jgi:hypothetical protein